MDNFLTTGIREAIYAPSFTYKFPPLDYEDWKQVINESSLDQRHSEFLGDGFLKSGFLVALWTLLPHREYSFYEAATRALTMNTTFIHLMLKAGVDDNLRQKSLGSIFEVLIGVWVKNKDPDFLYSYIIDNFSPLIFACEASYRRFKEGMGAQNQADGGPTKRKKLEHRIETKAICAPKMRKKARRNAVPPAVSTASSIPVEPVVVTPFTFTFAPTHTPSPVPFSKFFQIQAETTRTIQHNHQKDCRPAVPGGSNLPPFADGSRNSSDLKRSMIIAEEYQTGQQPVLDFSPPAHLLLRGNQSLPNSCSKPLFLGVYDDMQNMSSSTNYPPKRQIDDLD